MRALVRWCLGHRPVVLLATVIVVLAGLFGATQLRQQFFPEVEFPFLTASVAVPGVSAEQVDEQVSVPVEAALEQFDEAETVTTVANEGRLDVVIELAYGSDVDTTSAEMLTAMEEASLPPEAEAPEINSEGFASQPIMNVALSTDGDLPSLTDLSRDMEQRIEAIEGVERVDLSGIAEPTFDVEVKSAAIRQGLSPAAVAEAIKGARSSLPAGVVTSEGARTPLVVEGREANSAAQLRRLDIGGGRTLGAVAEVTRRDNAGESFARTNGKESVSLAVIKADRANEVAIIDEADKVLDDARGDLGAGNVTTIFENATGVRDSIRGLLIEGILGALFAVLVIFAFLRSGRATFVAAVSIPTSIVFGLLAAWALGLSLNIISLAGLTIAIGRVIDDAIVVLENIYKHLERGEPRLRAALDGTSEVANAIASSTLATAAVFLPIGLVGGLISEIFLSFSIIVVAALLASFLVAVTVIPVLGVLVLRPKAAEEQRESGLARLVGPATNFGLKHRAVTILAALLLFGGAIGGVVAGAVPIQFLPDSGAQQIYGSVQLPPGTGAAAASSALRPLERELDSVSGVKDSQVTFGDAAIDDGEVAAGARATYFLNLEEDASASRIVNRLRSFGEDEYGEDFSVQQIENGPPAGDLEITISGDDRAEVLAATERVDRLVRERDDVVETQTEVLDKQDQFAVALDADARGSVSPAQVAGALAGVIQPADAGRTADEVAISVRAPESVVNSARALEKLPVPGTSSDTAAAGGGAAAGQGGAQPAAGEAAAQGAGGAAAAGGDTGQAGGDAAGGAAGQAGAAAQGGGDAQSGGAAAGGAVAQGGGAASSGAGASPSGGSAQAAPPEPLTIGDVGSVERRSERASAVRIGGDIAGVTTGKILGEDTAGALSSLESDIDELNLQGVEVEFGGASEFIDQMFSDLLLAMAVAILLVYFVLVLFFGSVAQPITILAPVLLSAIGSLLGLILTGRALGLPAMIGQLLLIGIVVSNSILVVDTALRLRRQGVERNDALRQAARLRVRPVIMTAVATIAALTPLALGVSGEGGIISQSLGTVVIGGLLSATLLTLVIVPAVFTIFDRGRPHKPAVEELSSNGVATVMTNGAGHHVETNGDGTPGAVRAGSSTD